MKELSHFKGLQRSDVVEIRKSLSKLGLAVVEIDRELKYVWVDNPHPDFAVEAFVGKRDDELFPEGTAAELMAIKRDVFKRKVAVSEIFSFALSDGWRHYTLFLYPILSSDATVEAILGFAPDTFGFSIKIS